MTLTKCALAALLAAGLVALPAAAQPTAEEWKKALDNLEKATKDLKEARDALKTDDLRTKATTIDTKLDILDKDIQQLKKDVQEIRRRVGDGSSTSLRPDTDAVGRNMARVRVINTHPFEMSVLLNGRSFRIPAGAERLIPVLAGFYDFEVAQIPGDRRSGDLSPGQTKTFTIYPIP
jgi:uncharacterized protein YoxC